MTKTRSITLMEVSRAAGCSKAAASVVLNGSKGNIGVSDQLRRRVLAAARELNYRPNFASRSLALKRTRTLGLYIPRGPWAGMGGSYEGAILRGIETVCLEQGYNLTIINLAGAAEPSRCLDSLVEQRIDGLLVLHADGDEPWLAELVERSDAVAAVDCIRPHPRLDAVLFDHAAAIDMGVKHLAALGHRRIGYLGTASQPSVPHNEMRRQGFVDAMRAQGLALDPRWIFDATRTVQDIQRGENHRERSGSEGAAYYLSLGDDRPTALVAYDDVVAASAIRTFVERGLSLPDDMSLVNVEDTPLSRHLIPRLTSLCHPLSQMGAMAARRLIERAESPVRPGRRTEQAEVVGRHEYCQAQLTVRESTAPPRGG